MTGDEPVICKKCDVEVTVIDRRRPKYLCPTCGPLWKFSDVVGGTVNSPRGNRRAKREQLTTIVIRVEKCKLHVPSTVPFLFDMVTALEKVLARSPTTGEVYDMYAARTDDTQGLGMRSVHIHLKRMVELGLLSMEQVSLGKRGQTTYWSTAGEMVEWGRDNIRISSGKWAVVPKMGSKREEMYEQASKSGERATPGPRTEEGGAAEEDGGMAEDVQDRAGHAPPR